MSVRFLVFSDNEGCIIKAKGEEFDLSELLRLKQLLRSSPSIAFTICTGRGVPYVEAMTQALGIHRSIFPCICEGGGVLYWPAEDRTELLVEPFPANGILERLPTGSFRVEPGKVCCLSLYPQPPLSVPELAGLVTPYIDLDLYTVKVSSAAVDVTQRGVDKGFGIRRALGVIDCPGAKVVGVGDADNDLPMFDEVDYRAAPSNASSSVKMRAGFVSQFPDTRGLIDILENLIRLIKD